MRGFQSLIAMILLTTLFLVFLSSLHLEKTHSHKLEQKDVRKIIQVAVKPNATLSPLSKQARNTKALTISSGLRKAIPQNQAYWNRLLYSALGRVDKKNLEHHQLWSHCRDVDQELLKTNIHDFTSYPSMFQEFLMTMNCKSPPLLVNQPYKCLSSEGGPPFIFFAVKSRPGNFEQRQSVRETWGREGVFQNGLRVRTLFLLGNPSTNEPDLSALMSFEAKTFKDILQWDFKETLLNLTLKMDAFLHWTLKYCPQVSFIFSGDDDVFVNTPALLSYLQSLEPSKSAQLFVGHLISTAAPLRDTKSKYYIPLSFYDGPYPPYIGGGGFLISGSLLQRLHSISHVIPFYPIDDVYIGMCLNALGIAPVAHSGFHTFDVSEQDRENLCVHKGLILIHKRSPTELKKLWKGIHSPILTC
ncbi:N-acetyllactosaminide beta-1,3-N-acetylglucosaminyltransferase 2 [Eucyclogobius newberryi]|uniref:N-acetyllactosaminide beta-1,3-N-acetylglucosaminyltransferase 2 n=1 Tax=Eucyclogobius newberryi TaxID=166745 RepID=UPI003B59C44B